MRNLYVAIAFFLLSFSAIAQEEGQTILDKLLKDDKLINLSLDTRFDFRSAFGEKEPDEAAFRGHTIRVLLTGEIVPGIRYRVRHRLNRSQTPMRDGYSAATDQAWIALDAGEKWTFTLGKQTIQYGTFEYDYNSADLYQPTMVFSDTEGYKAGVDVAYRTNEQTMHLQIINADSEQFSTPHYRKKALAANLLWVGNIHNDLLKTRWGYGAYQHSKTKFYNWLTVGTQLNVKRFTTELDYYAGNRNINYGAVIGDEDLDTRYVKDQSVSLNLKYNFGKWKPFVKGTWNQRYDKYADKNAYESVGVQAVVEFYPFTNPLTRDLRFHAMYAYDNTNFQGDYSGLKNKDIHTLLVGTRWLFRVK